MLLFGLLRPYKGIDVALEAWRGIEDAELWVVGMPRMDTTALKAAAPPGVRFIERFVPDAELPAFFERADLVTLPYREIDQSGVLFTALAFGRPLVLSAVGGFPEVARGGVAELVPPGDARALHATLAGLLADPASARGARGARRRRRARALRLGRDRRAPTSSCTRARQTRRPDDRAEGHLLGAPPGCSSTRRPATRSLLAALDRARSRRAAHARAAGARGRATSRT